MYDENSDFLGEMTNWEDQKCKLYPLVLPRVESEPLRVDMLQEHVIRQTVTGTTRSHPPHSCHVHPTSNQTITPFVTIFPSLRVQVMCLGPEH